jgi:hypothetical protein
MIRMDGKPCLIQKKNIPLFNMINFTHRLSRTSSPASRYVSVILTRVESDNLSTNTIVTLLGSYHDLNFCTNKESKLSTYYLNKISERFQNNSIN